jgi:GNAT superfamily N-acetyltransferase
MRVRESGPHEADALLAVQRAASVAALPHVYPPDLYPYPDDVIRDRWLTFEGRVLLAEEDGEPLGVAAVEPCWLAGFYLVPERWGSGLADLLHAEAVAALRALGCSRARLWVLEDNPRARRFYERHGWSEDGSTRVVPFPPHPLDLGYSLALG